MLDSQESFTSVYKIRKYSKTHSTYSCFKLLYLKTTASKSFDARPTCDRVNDAIPMLRSVCLLCNFVVYVGHTLWSEYFLVCPLDCSASTLCDLQSFLMDSKVTANQGQIFHVTVGTINVSQLAHLSLRSLLQLYQARSG